MRRDTIRSRCAGLALMLAWAVPGTAEVFYEIVAPDGSRDWLLGTIHSDDPRVLDFPPVLIQALRQVDSVALELAPDAAMLERLRREMALPGDATLADRLPEALYRRALEAMVDEGVPEERARRMRPWAAAMMLAQPPGASGRFMDLALVRVAERLGARVAALETLDEQVAFFTGFGPAAHIEMLEAALERRDRRAEDHEHAILAYIEGDLARLVALAEDQLSRASAPIREGFRQRGLAERNRRMTRRALPMLARESVLVAVGALHLAGEVGLVALLRHEGYRVEPVY